MYVGAQVLKIFAPITKNTSVIAIFIRFLEDRAQVLVKIFLNW